jgi:hypothetical protein
MAAKYRITLSLLLLLASLPLVNAQTVLPLIEKGGTLFVTVKVNERDAFLLLDTGARTTVVTPDTINRSTDAAPIHGGAKLSGLSGSNGPIAESRIRVELIPHNPVYVRCGVMKLPDYLKGADGLIGNDVLGRFRIQIDYKAHTLTVWE